LSVFFGVLLLAAESMKKKLAKIFHRPLFKPVFNVKDVFLACFSMLKMKNFALKTSQQLFFNQHTYKFEIGVKKFKEYPIW
jgi:hypothetical protein